VRILTVCTSSSVFGAEVITLKTLEGFKKSGHEQLAVTTTWTDGEFNRRLANLGIVEIRLPFGTLSKRVALQPLWWTANVLARVPWLWSGWLRTLRQFQPDIILFTCTRHVMLLYPWLGSYRSYLIEYTSLEPTTARRWQYQLFARKLTGFIAVSHFMLDHVHRVGAPRAQIHVVRSAAFSESDLPRLESEAEEMFTPGNGSLRIGIVGQIASWKGHDCLVEAARLLRRSGRVFGIYVFGTGAPEYLSKLKDKIAVAELTDYFHWMGFQKQSASIYGAIDVCVVPSCFGDPFPTVAMEAGAYGLPVVATGAGGLPEIVEDGVTGWIVEVNAPKELADRLEWIMDNPDNARKMGLAGRERVFREFTQERMISEFEAVFAKALRNRKDLAVATSAQHR
jgi:glycosyltransferase involved in cell wall biosynthesis